jgi:hypothetical protein
MLVSAEALQRHYAAEVPDLPSFPMAHYGALRALRLNGRSAVSVVLRSFSASIHETTSATRFNCATGAAPPGSNEDRGGAEAGCGVTLAPPLSWDM